MSITEQQQMVCAKYSSGFCEAPLYFKIGISKNVKGGIFPINALRHPVKGDTTGWYIWSGDYSMADDFFVPMHVEHLNELCPELLKYLALAPGWRFLLADNYEDVWYDETLLNID